MSTTPTPAFTLTLSPVQEQALTYALVDPQFFIQSAIEGRANAALQEIVALETQRCAEDGTVLPETPEEIVQQAFARETVKTAAQVEAERVAALPPAENPVVAAPLISDRQFFQGLALQGFITTAEALDAVKTGALPQQIEAMVATLPESEQFSARMLLSGATTFQRTHPLVSVLGDMMKMTAQELDEFWAFCFTL